jgi:hypothetical protein
MRTETTWFDDRMNIVPSNKAKYVSVNKYDDDGNLVEELFDRVEKAG